MRTAPRSPWVRAVVATAFTLGLVGAAVGCRENTAPDEANELRDELGTTYRTWRRLPGHEERVPSATAHGKEVDVYWNERAMRSAGARPFQGMAPGSILVKEAYVDGELLNVAVMEKRFEGWFWAEWTPEGDILFSGRPGVCIDCHRRGDDFLRAISPSEMP